MHKLFVRLLPAAGAAALVAGLAAPASAQNGLAAGDPQTDLELTPFASGLVNPTDVAVLADGRVVITQKNGDIAVKPPNGNLIRKAGAIPNANNIPGGNQEQGLLGVVVDPASGALFFYASVGSDAANKHKVWRATISAANAFTWDAQPVIDMGLQGPANHNGGGLNIYNGQLYVSVGDTGANVSPPNAPQNKYSSCLNKANGKILRVNLDGSVPADNPLVGMATVTGCDSVNADFGPRPPDTRVYAWGLRNPYRFWVDPKTGLLWIGDVGEGTREEVSVGGKGSHFGYPFYEGTKKWGQNFDPSSCTGMTPARECTPPAYDWANNGSGGPNNCSIGGLILDGCGWSDAWKKRYVFGDHGAGNMWTIEVNGDRSAAVPNSVKDFGKRQGLSGFRMGPDGTLYVISHDGGAVDKVVPKNRPMTCVNAATGGMSGSTDAGVAGTGPAGGAAAGATGGGTGGAIAVGGGGGTSGAAGRAGNSGGSGGAGAVGGTRDAAASDANGSNADGDGGGCSCNLASSRPDARNRAVLVLLGLVAALARPKRRRR